MRGDVVAERGHWSPGYQPDKGDDEDLEIVPIFLILVKFFLIVQVAGDWGNCVSEVHDEQQERLLQ